MQTHAALGEQMLGGVAFLKGTGLRVVRHHHERWDGSGYPDQLAGEQIPLGARVFAVADSLDAMTSDRPYRPAHAGRPHARRSSPRRSVSSTRMSWTPSATGESELREIQRELPSRRDW